ncbi:N-6 DNA methylase [Myxococcota bacterium]|nr:N-6 DNA methylase [Myxococcota bacterium]
MEAGLPAAGRRARGQHFTAAAAVDLVLALARLRPGLRVLDPAAGAGAFLAGAARRAGALSGACASLTGVEVDPVPAAAARERLAGAGCPVDLRLGDLFDPSVRPGGPFDVVAGNPPYVRQEALSPGRKADLQAEVARALGPGAPRVDGRADLHLYFWFACAPLLAPGGRLALLASSAWLDAAYGESLQRLLLDRFAVEWVVESAAEPWFDAARVRTAAVVARREDDAGARAAARVRFVRFDRPLAELLPLPSPGDPFRRVRAADALVERLQALSPPEGIAVREVPQRDLRSGEGKHRGGKWGVPLRAPDLHDELRRALGPRAVPLGWIADVSFGLKSGADDFFFVRDLGPEDGAPHLRRIRSGDGTEHRVEARFLAPLAFNLMEVDRPLIRPGALPRRVLVLPGTGDLPPHAAAYVAWGEREGRAFHRRSSVRGRPRWYALAPRRAGGVLWAKIQQYRHLAPLNPAGTVASCNFYDVAPRGGRDALLLAAVLNAHPQVLSKHGAGRTRNEGVLKTEVSDASRMWTIDPAGFSPGTAARVRESFASVLARPSGTVPEECEREDRRALDLAVLEGAGLPPARARDLLARLHEEIRGLYVREREMEVRSVARRTRVGPDRTAPTLAAPGTGA